MKTETSKVLAKKILLDIYRNLDEFSKDVIRGDLADIEFKGFYLKGKNGEKAYIRCLEDIDHLEDFDVEARKYTLKSVNLKNLDEGLMIITLSSRTSKEYKFDARNYNIIYPTSNTTIEFKERILKWMELEDEELDEKIIEFDTNVNEILEELIDEVGFKGDVSVYIDVFMDVNRIENFVEREDGKILIWIHPVFLFSTDDVLRGLLAYELSRFKNKFLDVAYRDVIKYCKELKKLTNKKPKVLEKVKAIANKYGDAESLNLINEIENE
ncbi:conserved hypothetical protein [Methanocaldococcus vulcanius M7]|uniref:Uncharacterized protein n=1 Tax=Methanocaldococcus vulcanius (strain ATCC 700851 / DSM 12094 / M7) TaxID=579137 RepID=C9RGC3_METVM|nr:hypothetical protein [Methanocaldococcus vulcanius]ACX72625.1 conserved hypothetical protein [Methanocaldococcus vulcanius M7]